MAFCLAAAVSAAPARQPGGTAGTTRGSLLAGGITRTYLLHVPSGYSGERALPLVLALHGGAGTGAGMEPFTGLSSVADAHGFFVTYPDAVQRSWNDGRDVAFIPSQREKIDDVGFIAALIQDLARRYRIDSQRVYATGISNGAFFSHYLASRLSDRIAAIAAVVGGIAEPATPQYLPALLIGKTSHQINATNTIWSFFESHPKRPKIAASE